MPVVPFSPNAASPKGSDPEPVDPTYLLMAAAQMHSMDRLFEPEMAKDEIKPSGPSQSRDVISSDKVIRDRQANPPETIYDDKGQIVDYDMTLRKKK